MNYDQVEAFLTIVNERSLSKASEILYVSQSTVSHRLSSLEAELQAVLLQRKKGQRNVELTAAGERFVPIARRWKSLWEETTLINDTEHSEILRIGSVESCGCYLLPFLSDFSFRYRDSMKLNINITNSYMVYTQLEANEIDIGFITIPVWNRDIVFTPLLEEGFKLVCYDPERKMPDSIHPSELNPHDELLQPWNPEYQQWHNYWFPNQNKSYVYINNSHLMQRQYLEHSGGWTIVTDCIAEAYKKLDGFRVVDILSPPPRRTAYMAVHKHPRSSSANSITTFTRELLRYLSRPEKY